MTDNTELRLSRGSGDFGGKAGNRRNQNLPIFQFFQYSKKGVSRQNPFL